MFGGSTGGPVKSLVQIMQEQEDERLAKELFGKQETEEEAFWKQVELAQKLSLEETCGKQEEASYKQDKQYDEESEEEIKDDEDGDPYDYFVERQKDGFGQKTNVIPLPQLKKKKLKSTTEQTTGQPSVSDSSEKQTYNFPPAYDDVSTSCGRVYKNRIPRPITMGASKTRENGPMEVELNTGVPGLFLIYNFLSTTEESELHSSIESLSWDTNRAQTRRVQLYVPWKEEPKFVITPKPTITPLPPTSKEIAKKIKKIGKQNFRQFDWDAYNIDEDMACELQINEYRMVDALGFHKDNPIAYTEVICGVSLLCDCWIHYQYRDLEVKVLIPKRSLYFLTGEARYQWKHGIPPESLVGGEKRVSFTFRKVMYTKKK